MVRLPGATGAADNKPKVRRSNIVAHAVTMTCHSTQLLNNPPRCSYHVYFAATETKKSAAVIEQMPISA